MADTRSIPGRLTTDLAIVCLVGIAVTHFIDAGEKFAESGAWGWGVAFVLLAIASVVVAVLLNRLWALPQLWVAAAAVALVPMVGYVVSRTVAVPGLIGHLGDWISLLGILAMVCEAVLLALSGYALSSVFRLAPALNVVTLAMLTFSGFAAADGYPVGMGCAAKVMIETGGGHEMDSADLTTPCLSKASTRDRREAVRLWRDAWSVARRRFPTYEAAREAGYDYSIKPFDEQVSSATGLLHVTNRRALKDRRTLDPNAPESLAYQVLPDGQLSLAAFVFRTSSARQPPSFGGPIVKWHAHTSSGRLGKRVMAHVWMTPSFRTAYAMEAPAQSLADARFPPANRLAGGAEERRERRVERRPKEARVPQVTLSAR